MTNYNEQKHLQYMVEGFFQDENAWEGWLSADCTDKLEEWKAFMIAEGATQVRVKVEEITTIYKFVTIGRQVVDRKLVEYIY